MGLNLLCGSIYHVILNNNRPANIAGIQNLMDYMRCNVTKVDKLLFRYGKQIYNQKNVI
jgi:hypothetical protein